MFLSSVFRFLESLYPVPIAIHCHYYTLQACVEDLSALVSQVNEGEFINPAAIPNELLDELKLIQEKVLAVRSRLLGLSKWKEAITGQPHDLSGVSR